MAITSLTRWIGGSDESVVANLKHAKALLEKAGAESVQVGRIYSGPHADQWTISVRYADWETFAKVQKAVSYDENYHNPVAQDEAQTELAERTIIISMDL